MKKRIIVFIAVVLVIPLISITAFAADDDNDGLFGILSDIISVIFDGFYYIYSAIIKGVKAIGGFFASLIDAIGDGIRAIFKGLVRLFIPHSDYFSRLQDKIFNSFNEKFGGVLSLFTYLKERFSSLASHKNTSDLLIMKFPDGHLLKGFKFNLLQYGLAYIPYIRSLLTGLVTVMTVAFCYRRVLALLKT